MDRLRTDVLVVGGGNAGLCAALAAREAGAEVVVLERAPIAERGGNSAFTGGTFRIVYEGAEDVQRLIPDLSEDELDKTDWGSFTAEQYFTIIAQVTEHRADPDLAEMLITNSFATAQWMQRQGVRFVPTYGRHAHKVGDRLVFAEGVPFEVSGGGHGLVDTLCDLTEQAGIDLRYSTRALALLTDEERILGVVARHVGERVEIEANAVVLAAGGFQANTEWRTRYLGPGWDLAKVRGTRFNAGDGIRMALEAGAVSHGHWSGCHAVGWDLNAPEFGDLSVGDGFNKHQYTYGVMVNNEGERFVDEGADFRNYTYAKYGRAILNQPGQAAWQIFDAQVAHLLKHDFYRGARVTKLTGNTIEELADKLAREGVHRDQFLATIAEYNDAVQVGEPFDPSIKDGRGTVGLELPKTNWAHTLTEPPFEAFGITCGITFTFGGLRIDTSSRVLNMDFEPMPGLYACGEMAAGLFYYNYPGSTGLTWGSVTGKIAGEQAAEVARAAW